MAQGRIDASTRRRCHGREPVECGLPVAARRVNVDRHRPLRGADNGYAAMRLRLREGKRAGGSHGRVEARVEW